MTVEIGSALLTGAFVAALVFGAVVSPLLFTHPDRTGTGGILAAAGSAAGTAFVWRVVRVLRRFAGRRSGWRPGPRTPAPGLRSGQVSARNPRWAVTRATRDARAPTRTPGPPVGPGRGRPV
ncbi:DUF6332 family protein [Streptomyces sp. NPDC052496]|uniref:DUF6332 family protein n=1 Tax=Streptomyces sp. NPDC052496 TaxID=3154951 RepID=UPI003441C6C7